MSNLSITNENEKSLLINDIEETGKCICQEKEKLQICDDSANFTGILNNNKNTILTLCDKMDNKLNTSLITGSEYISKQCNGKIMLLSDCSNNDSDQNKIYSCCFENTIINNNINFNMIKFFNETCIKCSEKIQLSFEINKSLLILFLIILVIFMMIYFFFRFLFKKYCITRKNKQYWYVNLKDGESIEFLDHKSI